MSHRGGATSKLSKTEKKGEGKGREATPLVTNEIVPGRLNETEWSLLLDRDEGQDFAAEVVTEVVDAVLGLTYDFYLDIAVIPYTVDHFQALLEEIVEAEFPICDVGEPALPSADVDVIVPSDVAGEDGHLSAHLSDEDFEHTSQAVPSLFVAAADPSDAAANPSDAAANPSDAADAEKEPVTVDEINVDEMDMTHEGETQLNLTPGIDITVCGPAEGASMQDASWAEDEEPICGITDSWAQGSVPVQRTETASRPLSRISVAAAEGEDALGEAGGDGAESEAEARSRNSQRSTDEVIDALPLGAVPEAVETAAPERPTSAAPETDGLRSSPSPRCPWEGRSGSKAKRPQTPKNKKAKASSTATLDAPEGSKAPAGAIFLSTSSIAAPPPLLPHYSGAIERMQNGRPPGHKDIAYDGFGNVLAMARLDPDALPSHRVKTRFKVTAGEQGRDPLSKLSPLRSRRQGSLPTLTPAAATAGASPPPIPAMPTLDDIIFPLAASKLGGGAGGGGDEQARRTTMIDQIDLSPGVIIRDSERIKAGPEITPPDTTAFTRLKDSKRGSLNPIKNRLPASVTIKDMVERRTPTLRAYHEKPLLTTAQFGGMK